jgi:hypothetical protein
MRRGLKLSYFYDFELVRLEKIFTKAVNSSLFSPWTSICQQFRIVNLNQVHPNLKSSGILKLSHLKQNSVVTHFL